MAASNAGSRLSLEVPRVPDILTDYDFPVSDPTKPAFKVQKLTCALLTTKRRGYVLNDIGTGKTRCILWSFDFLQKICKVQTMLVIAPLSTLVTVWAKEIRKEFWWLKFAILHGTKEQRLKELSRRVDIYIINHHGVHTILPELRAKGFNIICADEAAIYRNGRSKTLTLPFKELVMGHDYAWGLTGSPMPHAVTDVWGPASCITPSTIPAYFSWFRAQLMTKVDQFKWLPRPHAEEMAIKCLQPSVRFKMSDVIELPERVYEYYHAPMTPRQDRIYKEMSDKAVALIRDKKIDALNAGAVMNKLLQISLGYVYTRDGNVVELDNKPRLQLIVDLIDSCSQSVILFAPYKSVINGLHNTLGVNDITHCIVSGDTSPKERAKLFHEFHEQGLYKVLLCHPACLAHGLTLTQATMNIWSGPITSLDIFYQANGRIHRLGQKHKTLIAMVGGSSREKRLYQLLGNNEQVQSRFLELIETKQETDDD
jgi:SNF2 family DNA or RNA helicase